MVLVDKGPLSGNLAKPDGQAKIEITRATVLHHNTAHKSGGECHVHTEQQRPTLQ